MFDDLRREAGNESSFEEEEQETKPDVYAFKEPPRKPKSDRLLGLTPVQRFVVAVILLAIVTLLSSFCLIVTGKIWLF